jgi:hypothetical protein
MLIGCQSDVAALVKPTVQKVIAESPTILPDYPAYCSEHVARVTPKVGEKWRHAFDRQQLPIDSDDVRKTWCAEWYRKRQVEAARGMQTP